MSPSSADQTIPLKGTGKSLNDSGSPNSTRGVGGSIIPDGWDVYKISHGFNVVGSGTTPKSDNLEYYDGKIPWITTSELRENLIVKAHHLVTKKALIDYSALKYYPIGTLLIAMYGATIGRMGILGIPATVNQACCALSEPSTFDSKFVYYWLWAFRPSLISLSSGGGQPNLSQEILKSIRIPCPAIHLQQKIANYLDNKTTQIDDLIAKKQRQIELLKEKRSALITQAVTKGLNPNVKMKDSGVEWLGDIPEQWEVKPLFAVLHEKKTKNIGLKVENVLSLSYGRIVRRDVESNYGLLPDSFETYQIVVPDDIIMRLTDLQNDKRSLRVGQVKEEGIITSAYVCLKATSRVNPKYTYLLLHAYDLIKLFYHLGAGVRQSMRFEDLKRIPIPIPPLSEQIDIAEGVERRFEHISGLINKIQSSIALMMELRSSLISEAVTGKLHIGE